MIRSHFLRCLGPWAAAAALVALEGAASCQEPHLDSVLPKAALIDRDRSAASTLLESKLLAGGQANWVERSEIVRILKEQELATAFGAQGGKERLALGKLLKADVLVLVRNVKSTEKDARPSIECVVCETHQGLRLQVAAIPADSKDETIATALEAVVQRGLARQAEKITAIVAIPPLVSDDLGFEHNHLQSAYAKLVEQVLLETSGLVVVELAEAQAIAQELALAAPGTPVERRDLPLYLFGRFRHYGAGDKQTVAVRLRLVRGELELARYEQRDIPPTDAPAWLRAQAAALLPHAQLAPAKPTDPAIEAKQLAERAAEFQKIGNAEEALALIEASLLLNPDQPQLHHDAVVVSQALVVKHRNLTSFSQGSWREASRFYLRGLQHLEQFMHTAGPMEDFRKHGPADFAWHFQGAGMGLIDYRAYPREVAPLMRETADEAAKIYLQIARFRAARGFGEEKWVNYAMAPLEESRQLPIALRMIEEFQDQPDIELRVRTMALRGYSQQSSPAFGQFVDKLLAMKSEKIQRAARALKEQMTADSAPPVPAPAKEGAEIRELLLTSVKFEPLAGQPPVRPPYTPSHSIRAGPDLDILWSDNWALYRMREAGKLDNFWRFEELNFWFKSVVFDGRYLWLAATRHRGPYVLAAIDLKTGRESRFSPADGWTASPADLPDNPTLPDTLKLAALEPGKVCVVGYIGRTFIGTASISLDGTKAVQVFHEARVAPIQDQPAQAENAAISFEPVFAFLLQGREHSPAQPQQRVLIGRNCNNPEVTCRPLLVDPNRGTVEVAPYQLACRMDERHFTAAADGVYSYDAVLDGPNLTRIAFPGHERQVVAATAPEGFLLPEGDKIHIVGTKWWVYDIATSRIRVAASPVPWTYFNQYHYPGRDPNLRYIPKSGDILLQQVQLTRHLGPIAVLTAFDNGHHSYLRAVAPPSR